MEYRKNNKVKLPGRIIRLGSFYRVVNRILNLSPDFVKSASHHHAGLEIFSPDFLRAGRRALKDNDQDGGSNGIYKSSSGAPFGKNGSHLLGLA